MSIQGKIQLVLVLRIVVLLLMPSSDWMRAGLPKHYWLKLKVTENRTRTIFKHILESVDKKTLIEQ